MTPTLRHVCAALGCFGIALVIADDLAVLLVGGGLAVGAGIEQVWPW